MFLARTVDKSAARFITAPDVCLKRCFSSTLGCLNNKPTFQFKTKKKTKEDLKEEEAQKRYQEALESGDRFRIWAAYARTNEYDRKALKWYILGYGAFILYGITYFKKAFAKEKEKEALVEKFQKEGTLSEWEHLRLKELNHDKLRTTDSIKLAEYHKLWDEYKMKLVKATSEEELAQIGEFDPKPEDISEYKEYQTKILPPKDLTELYNELASNYDSDINLEETLSFMGSKRKWLMKEIEGDVLEVACGTGRNIKYLDPTQISSITFLDASTKMLEIAKEKFRRQFPQFPRAAFVVGKAEDLLDITSKDDAVKYDCIVETFGLCSHYDPVKALKNMARLLKPGGRVILLEHGRGSYDFINNQLDSRADRHSKTWGCRWNLDIGELLDQSGLEIVEEKRHHFGTTWCVIAKNPGDTVKPKELGWYEKYFKPSNPSQEAQR
ncbi:Putative methyltransferase [Komagataella phaffii CBS 7435]|uniref:Protein integral to the mitochondrial membrane n=2 Tax=Komagataella phaffii TaxID=460519 RepID=C4R8I6_KOMPG|nr:Protein integral to the mitochondrial membrane [Komagataella phaffii GS115]AOA64518.1 GQ67_05028T0 [Komagataella phaffii]CAH2450687.1 Putative methyltransferase [Komagataella phaffii CBS 7435]AOA69497.1 GQ68_05009T0 [Komagataella phaffii GS115]CAY71911.1 Protein integral to the mitochondrial membrane [Komagataella phaffii GS115]CCA40487.1 Putative methyltransferase [Komagataella phaffii CBS 7435]